MFLRGRKNLLSKKISKHKYVIANSYANSFLNLQIDYFSSKNLLAIFLHKQVRFQCQKINVKIYLFKIVLYIIVKISQISFLIKMKSTLSRLL